MISRFAFIFEKAAKQFGLIIRIPRPGKKTQRTCAIVNGSVGISLLAAGIAFAKQSLILLGILGLSGAVFSAYFAYAD